MTRVINLLGRCLVNIEGVVVSNGIYILPITILIYLHLLK